MTSTKPSAPTNLEPGCQAETGLFCARKHWSVYWIIIALTLVTLTARVMHVQNFGSRGDTPFFSANDRSRWCTVHSLVDYGTYEIDRVINRTADIHWDTIDKVRHVGADGQFHYYSSKPPFLATVVAGQYYLLQKLTGWRIDQETIPIVRVLLWFNMVLPFGLFLWSLARVLDRMIVADWTRYYVLAVGGCGTFLSTFSITLNNHVPAAVVTMLVIDGMDLMMRGRATSRTFVIVGICAALSFTFELPALSLLTMAVLVSVISNWRKSLILLLPPAVVIVVANFFMNFLAHGELGLAYSHRHDGPEITQLNGNFEQTLLSGQLPIELKQAILNSAHAGTIQSMSEPYVEQGSWMGAESAEEKRWVVRDRVSTGQFAILQLPGNVYVVKSWSNWYDFPGSYWAANNPKRSTVDRGTRQIPKYLFHCLFGHHGILSLTPLWVLSAAGLLVLLRDRWMGLRFISGGGLVLTLVILVFYLQQPEHDRNYGGQTSGLRWTFWLIPFWLLGLVPIVQRMAAKPWQRLTLLVLLIISALSAAYSWPNPWVHPWLYEVWPNWLFPA